MKEEELKSNFARNLYSLRKAKNLSQAQLAADLNYTHKAISKWENKETLPDITTFKNIAEYFDITLDQLIGKDKVVSPIGEKKKHIRITMSAIGICFAIVALIYLVLEISKINKSYVAIPFAFFASGIIYLIFSCLWFKKYNVFIAVSIIIWTVALITLLFLDFQYLWIILAVSFIIDVAFVPFLKLIFESKN